MLKHVITLSEGCFKLQDIFNNFTCTLICPIAVLPHSEKVVDLIPGYNRPFCVALGRSLCVRVGTLGSPTIKNSIQVR